MSKESGNKIIGGVILIGILIIIFSFVGAIKALGDDQYSGAGILMLAASLPITAAIHGVMKKK
ncbi:MAG: hypothetical protein AB8H03_03675 [Saprospiraceae bacterium]